MRSNRQIDKLEQWVMHRACKDDVLGSMLSSNEQKGFSTLSCLCYTDLAFKSVSLLISLKLKAETHLAKHRPMNQLKTVNLGETDVFNKRIVT